MAVDVGVLHDHVTADSHELRVQLHLAQHVVAPVAREYRPGLIALSAGYDAHRSDPLAECMLDACVDLRARVRQRERIARVAHRATGRGLDMDDYTGLMTGDIRNAIEGQIFASGSARGVRIAKIFCCGTAPGSWSAKWR